jgi:glycyl-tRNA synthetase (class II)
MNMDKLMGKMVDKMEEQVLAHQPEGYTEEDIKAIMAELKVAMEEDRVGPEDMQRMAQYMTEEFDEQRSLELLNMIQEILGHPEVQEEEMPPDTLQAVPDSL